MLVNEWVQTVWKILQVRPKTLHDYKRLFRRHLEPVIGHLNLNDVDSAPLQQKLLTLPPQTARHTLMLAETIWREALSYGITNSNPISRLRTTPIQVLPKKFLTR